MASACVSAVTSDAAALGARAPAITMLTAALAGFAAGTVLLQWQPVLPRTSDCLAAGALAAGCLVLLRVVLARETLEGWRRLVVRAFVAGTTLAVAAAVASGWAAWRAHTALADALPPEWEGRDIALVGIVDDLPHVGASSTRLALAVERVITPGASVPGRVSLAWFASGRPEDGEASQAPRLRAGERWQMVVRLKRPHGNVNPHGFDLEAWLLENGLRATGYVHEDARNRRIDAFAGRPTDWVQRAREHVRERALRALGDAPYAGVIVALAIGEQRAIPESQWVVFNRTGITHLISISGLHVTVFAALAAALCYRAARRSVWLTSRIAAHRVAVAAGSAAAFAYVLLAGAQVPAQRTLIMLCVAAGGLWLARPGTARIVWLWALVAVLAVDPWAGLAPGFWLSFGAVGLLLYAGTSRLHTRSHTVLQALREAVRGAAQAQLVVTVGLVPLTLAIFQQVSLASPLANAIAIPVVTFAVVPLALLGIVVPLDVPWQLAHAVFAALMLPLEAIARWPTTTWQQHAPAAWTIPAAVAGVLWLLAPRGLPLRVLGWGWLLPLFVIRPPSPAWGAMRITVLDVGQGLAVVVQTQRHVLLYDTGPRFTEEADAGGRIIAPYLRAAGVTRLSRLVVSHLDADHSGGARTLVQTVPIEGVLTSVAADDPLFDGLGPSRSRCGAGESWWWDGVRFVLVHPPAAMYVAGVKTNDLSCVLRIESSGGTALLTGDAEARSEGVMLASGAALRADVVVVPHHGSRTSSSPAFVAAVAPRLAVFTPGYRNRFGHPRPEIVARYRELGAALARTDYDGAITIEFGAGAIRWAAERERQHRYWYDAPRRQ